MVDERLTRWTQPITFRFQRKRSNRRDLIIHCQEMVRWWLNSINIETGSRVFFRCLFSIGWSSPTVDETPFVVAEEPRRVLAAGALRLLAGAVSFRRRKTAQQASLTHGVSYESRPAFGAQSRFGSCEPSRWHSRLIREPIPRKNFDNNSPRSAFFPSKSDAPGKKNNRSMFYRGQ